MLKKLAIASLCALSAAAFITGCGSSQKPASSAAASAPAEKKEITVGATAGPHAEVVEAAAKEAVESEKEVKAEEENNVEGGTETGKTKVSAEGTKVSVERPAKE